MHAAGERGRSREPLSVLGALGQTGLEFSHVPLVCFVCKKVHLLAK